jgi:hypothetical protein
LSVITRLLSIPDRKTRSELERLTLKNAWGRGRLDQEIVSRLRRSRAGSGRRPDVSTDGPSILSQLDQYIESWVRWEVAASRQGVLYGSEHILPEEIERSLQDCPVENCLFSAFLKTSLPQKCKFPRDTVVFPRFLCDGLGA